MRSSEMILPTPTPFHPFDGLSALFKVSPPDLFSPILAGAVTFAGGAVLLAALPRSDNTAIIGLILLVVGMYAKGFTDGGRRTRALEREIGRLEKIIETLQADLNTVKQNNQKEYQDNITFWRSESADWQRTAEHFRQAILEKEGELDRLREENHALRERGHTRRSTDLTEAGDGI